MPKAMTPRARVEAALRREPVDKVPFTIYETFLPQTSREREMRELGMCIVNRRYPVYKAATPNVVAHSVHYVGDDGEDRIRRVYETPVGTLYAIDRPAPGTSWREERIFHGPEDYRSIEYMIRDRVYRANYEEYTLAERDLGEDVFLRGAAGGYSPLQEIIYTIMGVETFSMEWGDRRDEVMRLYDALTEDRRKIYPIAADSPALAFNYCGNVSPEVMGPKRFEQYIIPHYEECAEALHKRGKFMGVHLDANNWPFADAVARSSIDYVEAFTPPPTCDMSVADARRVWPDKVLWINFPSSVHVLGPGPVAATTREILAEAAPGDGFLIGITEDMPPELWQDNCLAIARTVDEHGRLPIGS